MSYRTNSDYSYNKKTDDIVYFYINGEMDRYIKELDNDGKLTGRILHVHKDSTGAMHTRVLDKSEMTVEQFDMVKAFSDANYHETDNDDVCEMKNTVSLSGLEECDAIECSSSAEDEFFAEMENDEAEDYRTIENADKIMEACLTEKQRKRYYAYYFEGMTMDEIAAIEGTKRHPIWKSIRDSEKKIKIFLEKGQKRGTKTPQKR